MELTDIYNNTKHPVNLYFTSPGNTFAKCYEDDEYDAEHHIIHNCRLPNTLKDVCKEKYGNKLCSNSLYDSDGWHLFFRDLTGTATSVTALHPDFIQPGSNPLKFWGYNINIGKWTAWDGVFNGISLSRVVYSRKEQTLYRMSSMVTNNIYAFNLGKKDNGIDWRWNIWKEMDHICEPSP